MNKETIDRANEILEEIRRQKTALNHLEKYKEKGSILYHQKNSGWICSSLYTVLYFEPWEIRLMIHQKKQRIQALENEFEKL